MRLLVLLTDAYGGHGGIAKYNRDLLESFCSHSAVSEVVALPRSAPNPFERFPRKLVYRTAALGSARSYLQALGAEMLGKKYDLVFCAHINLLPLAVPAAVRYRTPLSLMIYGIDAWAAPRMPLRRHAVHAVDSVASISQTTLDRFVEWSRFPRSQCHLLPNAFNAREFGLGAKPDYLLERYGLRERTVLMTFGRLAGRERAKGFDEVLEALPGLLKEKPNLAYMIAGDGDDRQRLEEKAQALGVRDRVVFTGMIAESEKADHYRTADLYVMPSRGEGFGFVFLEALACGIPCIGSKIDGSREALRDGLLGALVHPGDAEQLHEEILRGLRLPRSVPTGLSYFEFPEFERRTHHYLDRAVVETRGRAARFRA